MNEKRLTKKVYEEQKRLGLPNCWHKEVMSDLKMLDINRSEENIRNITRAEWKSLIKEKLKAGLEDNIKNTKMTKLRFIKQSNFGIKKLYQG